MRTQKHKSLEYIANSFRAADKIRSLQQASAGDDKTRSVLPSNPETLRQMLEIITQYSPDTYRSVLSDTLQKANMYSESYRNLKQQINHTRTEGLSADQIIRTLSVVRPVVAERQRVLIDKIIRIHEILKS